MIINIMCKKNNINDLSKYDNLSDTVVSILNNWKNEKDELVDSLIEIIKFERKTK